MAAGDLLNAAYQVELNGLLMGPGTAYDLTEFNPFNSPTVREGDRDLPLQHGLVPGFDLYGGRTVDFKITVRADGDELQKRIADLAAAFRASTDQAILAFSLETTIHKRKFYGRPRRIAFDTRNYGAKSSTAIAEYVATDPRMYELTDRISGTVSPTPPGGLVFPSNGPFDFGPIGTAGIIDVLNVGTMATPWAALISGPVTDPSIYHEETDSYFEIRGAIAAGDTLLIDSATRTIALNQTANRMNMMAPGSVWFEIQPGSNELRFNSGSSTGGIFFQWTSAWY